MKTLSFKTPENPKTDSEMVRREVLALVDESRQRLTPGKLKKRLCEEKMVDASTLKAVIRDLVLSRDLKYTYQFGCSFIEKSYDRPVRISERVVLKPPDTVFEPAFQDIVIEIIKGASFGFGDHPTTRLAILGIEAALSVNQGILTADNSQALDFGTGSGVLAITAVLLGIPRAVGIDIDPCARTEAKTNAKLNGLEHRIAILDAGVEDIKEPYALIMANLRYPTLRRLCSHMDGILQKDGAMVLSGITANEVEDLLGEFTRNGFRCTWKAEEKGWAGMVFIRA
ncbi:MAG: 50S ribosomal protein L11 methyltransferase [Desulfobacterales bacterium]